MHVYNADCVRLISILFCAEKPVITATSSDVTVLEGTDVILNCSATGFPTPSYQWIRLGGDIPADATGTNTSILLIPESTVDEGGLYACEASNYAGSVQSYPVQVTVLPLYGK